MKEKIILEIASLPVSMDELKQDLAAAKKKFEYFERCFSWATVVALLNEIKDKNKTIQIAGNNVLISDLQNDVEVAKTHYHYRDLCFTWATVQALCDVVEKHYSFQGLYFFYNDEGFVQVQSKKHKADHEWFAVEQDENKYALFCYVDGVMQKIKELTSCEIRHFANGSLVF